MKTKTIENQHLDVGSLVEDLLGLDPSAVASMRPPGSHRNDATLLGLKTFLARTMRLAIQLSDDKAAVLRLTTGATDIGWPDARTANLARLFAWALARERRWFAGLPFLQLEPAAATEVGLSDETNGRAARMPLDDLVAELTRPITYGLHRRCNSTPRYPVSICRLIREMLRIDPAVLAARFVDGRPSVATFATDPEGYARGGLESVVLDAIAQAKVMASRCTDRIRMMGDEDAKAAERPNARIANTITLLSAALHADDEHVITFEPPKPRPVGEEEWLRGAAKLVYLDFSDEALSGLEQLCEGNVHFGAFGRFSRAERLLHSVSIECDPELQRMPLIVAIQTCGIEAIGTSELP